MRHLISPAGILFSSFVVGFAILATTGSAVAEQYAVIYRFQGGTDGVNPTGDLISDSANNLYGTTSAGGTVGQGTVYQLTPPTAGILWTETILYSFGGGSDGRTPEAGLVRDAAGNLYGTTANGGTFEAGTVFELSPPSTTGAPWTETVLHNFAGGTDGYKPLCKLILGKGGVLFGTTFGPAGTIFKLTPPAKLGGAWTERTLYVFTGGSDGSGPWPGLSVDKSNNLYGVTEAAGVNGNGTAFELSPPVTVGGPWTETTLHSFGPSEGANPVGELVLDPSGNVYGMTNLGPITTGYGCGYVFQLVPPAVQGGAWTENLLYNFTGGNDGCEPYSGLVFDNAGDLLGVNAYAGSGGGGAIFTLSPSGGTWSETTLHDFVGGPDGLTSYSTLVRGKGGAYFGSTTLGGGGKNSNYGTVFEVKP